MSEYVVKSPIRLPAVGLTILLSVLLLGSAARVSASVARRSATTTANRNSGVSQFAAEQQPLPPRQNPPGAGNVTTIAPSDNIAATSTELPPQVDPASFFVELEPGDDAYITMTVSAGQQIFGKGDIVFVFDRTGSMGDEIDAAKASAIATMQQIRTILPHAWFGVGSFMDYPGTFTYPGYSASYGEATAGDVPWEVNIQPTAAIDDVSSAINGLWLGYGNDWPEDYTRALSETIGLNWRNGAKKVVVLYGDAPTHDLDFNGENYGGDPGPDEIAGTADDLDFETTVNNVAARQISVIAVNSGGPTSEPTFRGMSVGYAGLAGTSGGYFDLSNSADLPTATAQLIGAETSQIDLLTVRITEGYESWFESEPLSHAHVAAGTTAVFKLNVRVPNGTPAGYYPIMLQAIGDSAILGTTYVGVTVPTESPLTDTGFRPAVDGYDFGNTFGGQWDWEMFRTFFGNANVEHTNGNLVIAAKLYFDSFYAPGFPGTADGLAATSLINYLGLSQPNAGRFALAQSKPLNDMSQHAAQEALTFAQGIQGGLELAGHGRQLCRAVNSSPHAMFQSAKSEIAGGQGTIISIGWDQTYDLGPAYDHDLTPGAHSLVAYRYEDPPGSMSYLYVYDPNVPNEERRIEFEYVVDDSGHVTVDRWAYDWDVPLGTDITLGGDGTAAAPKCLLFNKPIEIYQHEGVPPWKYAGMGARAAAASSEQTMVFFVNGPAAPLFTDDEDRRLGWLDGVFYNEIPDASYLPLSTGTGSTAGSYLVPSGVIYTLDLHGLETGSASVSIWNQGYMAQVTNLTVSPGSLTRVKTPLGGGLVTVENVGAAISGTLVLNRLLTDEDFMATVGGLGLDSGESATLEFTDSARAVAPDGIRLSSSSSVDSTYDLSLVRSGGTGLQSFGHPSLDLPVGASVMVQPDNWSDLSTVNLLQDLDGDGVYEESTVIDNVTEPSNIKLETPLEIIVATGGKAQLVVYVTDQFGAPVMDGTIIKLEASEGDLSVEEAGTVGGYIVSELTVADDGVSEVTITAIVDLNDLTTEVTIPVIVDLPTISGFSPTSGAAGTSVTISGTNLAGTTSVKFNGTSATVTSATATQVVALVPSGATTGRIKVSTPVDSATSTSSFSVVTTPTITGFTPTSGAIGAAVTINGTNLSGATAVSFNGAAATITSNSATQIAVTVPSGATTGKVSVTTPGGTVTSSGNFTVIPAPTVTGFTPTSGAIGTSVTINGTNLSGATAVSFNGTAASIASNSATQIAVTVPSGATTGKVSVTTPGGSATSASDFTVIPAPTVTGFTPTSGAIGTSVTINGTNLSGATAVSFNGTAASITSNSATQIAVTVPSGATTGKVSVTTPGGSATSANNFTVTAATPTITSFTPGSGAVNTIVTINGTNLTNGSVTIGGKSATVTSITATKITVTVPTDASTGPIAVTTPNGTATSSTSFVVLPSFADFSPKSGLPGTEVIITGTGLDAVTAVTFNKSSTSSFVSKSATMIKVNVPMNATTGKITLTTTGGSKLVSKSNFTVLKPPKPTITSFSPSNGAAGTLVTIDGTNLLLTTDVKFGTKSGTGLTVISDTKITVLVPAGAKTGVLSLTTPGGTVKSKAKFTAQ